MRISIIHPSRGRPQQAFETATRWIGNSESAFEYILSLDNDDPKLNEYKKLFDEDHNIYQLAIGFNNQSAINAINFGAELATGDLLIVISDDMDCFPGWDTALLNELSGKSDFVLKTRDGIQKTLVTLPIVDRTFYNRYGYIYFDGYSHMCADQELTAVAIMTGKLLYSDLLFEHRHYITGKTQRDSINEKNDATYTQGQKIFDERLKNNFGIINPLIQYNQIIWH